MGSTIDRRRRPRRSPRRAGRLAALGCCAVVLQSCFTGALWGYAPDLEGGFTESPLAERTDEIGIGWKLLLSPFTLIIDCVTWPFQEFLFDDDEPEREASGQRSRC